MYSWREIYELSLSLMEPRGDGVVDGGEGGGNDEIATYRIGAPLPVIIWDAEARQRRVVPMRWGIPAPKDWRRPQPIHARSDTIDTLRTFEAPFRDGQHGIVVFRTFNEGEEVATSTGGTKVRQWTVNPRDGRPRGFAFLWQRFEIPELPAPMLACVMVTVPANELIRRSIKSQEADPRMPAIPKDDAWETWLGEGDRAPPAAKAVLKAMEGVNWQAAPEPKKPRSGKARLSPAGGGTVQRRGQGHRRVVERAIDLERNLAALRSMDHLRHHSVLKPSIDGVVFF